MTKFTTRVCNGLGDRLLDIVGFSVMCLYLQGEMGIDWTRNRVYDPSLLELPCEINTPTSTAHIVVHNQNQCVSLSPVHVFSVLKKVLPDITFEEMAQKYISIAQSIKPSHILEPYVPDLSDYVCIHLRRTDKLNNGGDMRHETNWLEYEKIMNRLIVHVSKLISEGEHLKFYVISDDLQYKQVFIETIRDIAKLSNKEVSVYQTSKDDLQLQDYEGAYDVLEFFAMCKCKMILQPIKYSTFSVMAAMISQAPLINFHAYQPNWLLLAWKPCINVTIEGVLYDHRINPQEMVEATSGFIPCHLFVGARHHQ